MLHTNFEKVIFVKSATNCGSKCTSECGTYLWSQEGGGRRRQGLQVHKCTSVQVSALSVQVSVVTGRWCEKEARIATNSLREASDGSTYCE